MGISPAESHYLCVSGRFPYRRGKPCCCRLFRAVGPRSCSAVAGGLLRLPRSPFSSSTPSCSLSPSRLDASSAALVQPSVGPPWNSAVGRSWVWEGGERTLTSRSESKLSQQFRRQRLTGPAPLRPRCALFPFSTALAHAMHFWRRIRVLCLEKVSP